MRVLQILPSLGFGIIPLLKSPFLFKFDINMEQLQYISDKSGKKLAVILPIEAYSKILDDLEQFEDIKLYDEAKAEDNGDRILLTDYLKKRKLNIE